MQRGAGVQAHGHTRGGSRSRGRQTRSYQGVFIVCFFSYGSRYLIASAPPNPISIPRIFKPVLEIVPFSLKVYIAANLRRCQRFGLNFMRCYMHVLEQIRSL